MTIKEIEALSGMSRANIRYYETEGFLSPERRENGYRDYSEEDLETLKRIKLLRLLGVSLADIKAAKEGSLPLEELMTRRLAGIAGERTALSQSEAVCRELREAQVRYEDLDAQRYLDELSRRPGGAPDLPREDAEPKVTSPIRRFLARWMDLTVYSLLWDILLTAVFRVNISQRSGGSEVLAGIIAVLMMLFLEPLLLRVFGTTLGKWVLGLSVTDREEGRLSYPAGLLRTWNVFLYGLGLNIPIVHLYRLWKSYKACDQGETLPWEEDSVMHLREDRFWLRCGSFAAACFVLIGGLSLSLAVAQRPLHRGEITVAEFCENYNRLAVYYDPETASLLEPDGSWKEPEGTVVISLDGMGLSQPELHFTEDGSGRMTGVTISFRAEGDTFFVVPTTVRILATLAFAQAQPGVGLLDRDAVNAVIDRIQSNPTESFQETVHGVEISSKSSFVGYSGDSGTFITPLEGTDTYLFTMDYTMALADAG